jgi:hypothetical protein
MTPSGPGDRSVRIVQTGQGLIAWTMFTSIAPCSEYLHICEIDLPGGGKTPPPIREAMFASLRAPLRRVLAPVDRADANEEREASDRRRAPLCDSRKTSARPARSS